jgi:hypothetical protein
MTKLDFVVLCVRLLALHTIAHSFASLRYLVGQFFPQPTAKPTALIWAAVAAPFVLQVSFGLFLWLFATGLGRFCIASGREHEKISRWQPREVATIALAYVGVTMTGFSLAITTSHIASYMSFAGRGTAPSFLLTGAVTQIPVMALGLILLFGARFLSFWLSPRANEIEPQSPSDAES